MSLGTGFSAFSPGVGDFNGDGLLDLVLTTTCLVGNNLGYYDFLDCSQSTNNNTYLALDTGAAFNLGPAQVLGSGWDSYIALPGDVNGDGRTDLIFSDLSSNLAYVSVALANGSGGLTLLPYQAFDAASLPYATPFTGDFNGDGRTDLGWYERCPAQLHCRQADALTQVSLAKSDGTFQAPLVQELGLGDWALWALQTGDVDGNGRTDLIWTHTIDANQAVGHLARVGLADGQGGFSVQPIQQTSTSLGDYNRPLFRPPFGDLTGDGKTELLWNAAGELEVLLNGPSERRVYLPLVQR